MQTFQQVLVTGGCSGIGLAITEALLERGLKVIMVAHLADELEAQASRLQKVGHAVQGVLVDLSRKQDLQGLWNRLEAAHGPIDVLVNNAGIGYNADLLDSDLARIRAVFEINYFAPLDLCQQALRSMAGRRRGHIVNLTSASARRGLAKMSGYAASKAALHALTQTLRLEAAPLGVGVSEVLPISVATSFFERHGYRPQGLVQQPQHVARCVLRCLDENLAELCTHRPTAWGFVLDALAPNQVARLLSWINRRRGPS